MRANGALSAEKRAAHMHGRGPGTCESCAVVTVFWAIVGGLVVVLLLAAALMDRNARRRHARIVNSGDIWREVRESRRDAEVIDSTGLGPARGDINWTSWSRRNHSDGP